MPREYTEAEALAIHHDYWESNRPDAAEGMEVPELVRWSEGDSLEAAACIREQGFEQYAMGLDGSIGGSAPTDAQRARSEVVEWECWAKFSLPLQWIAPRTEELWRLEYDYYVDFYLPCMKEWGIDLYRDDIPSEDVWVAQSMEGQVDLWLPYDLLHNPPVSDHRPKGLTDDELAWLCPSMPPPVLSVSGG
nr:hypothetical protein [Actinomyces sp.]